MTSAALDAALAYLALLRNPPGTARKGLRALARALDRLSAVYHDIASEDAATEDAAEAPRLCDGAIRAMAERAFPDLGFYGVVRSLDVPPPEPLLADAIDDLADIAREMLEVEWRWLNTGSADALWTFRFGYRAHWGRHLHDLRSHIHALQFEGPTPTEPPFGD